MRTDTNETNFTAGEALERHRFVKLTAAKTVSYADDGDDPIGITKAEAKSGANVPVWLLGAKCGTFTVVCDSAVAVNAELQCQDDGKVADNGGGPVIGIALQAGTADGSEIEMMSIPGSTGRRRATNTETLAADKTMATTDAELQFLDPGGSARNVDLPAEASSDGLVFHIFNTADAAEALTVRDDAGATTIIVLDQDQHGVVACNGTLWQGFIGAET